MNDPDSVIYVVGHVTRGFGAVQAIQQYLMARGATFCAIEHPLFVDPRWTSEGASSVYRRYDRGRKVSERSGRAFRRPQAIRYLKDLVYTVWCGLREPTRIELFIGIDNLNALSGLILKWLGRVRRVVFYTVDYATTARFSNPLLDVIYRRVDRISVLGADEVWSVSDRIRQERLRMTRDPRKLRLVPNTVDLSQIPNLATIQRIPGRLIFMGGLMQESGLDELIEALPEIRRAVPTATLVIIGGGPSESSLRHLVECCGLHDVVRFLGYRPYAEALQEVAQSCLGISPYSPTAPEAPYLYYCDPSKVKAYLACGCPVVIYGLPEITQVIMEAKAGVSYRTRAELVHAVTMLLGDEPMLAQYRANALRLAARYDQTRVLEHALEMVAG